jgi:penicillin-binding protein 2
MAVDRRSKRLGMLAAVAVLLLGALGTRLWFLQGVQSAEYQTDVDRAKTRTVFVPPARGRILDVDGRVLADNERILTVTVDWSAIRNRPETRATLFQRLSGYLKVPVAELEKRYKSNLYDPLLPLPLKEDVDEATVTALLERSEDHPGVGVVEEWRRVYPYAPLASHVVGYMGALNENNVDAYMARGYNRNERVGAFGVEQSMEEHLHGTWGSQVWEVDASGSTVRLIESTEPVAGNDIQLSIDLDVQQYAEQALEQQLRNRRELPQSQQAHNGINPKSDGFPGVSEEDKRFFEGFPEYVPYKAPAGSVVVMNHSNGQVVAMASYPTFDNRWFNSGIGKEKFDQLFPQSEDPDDSILVNRAVQGRYNLGSSIKPFIAWSAVHSGIIGPREFYRDEGTYTLQTVDEATCASGVRCEFKNAIDPFGEPSRYGPVSVEEALAVSSDAYFYRLGELFFTTEGKRDQLKSNLEKFGFGADSDIDLPYEWDGRIPDDAIKKDLVERGVLAEGEAEYLVTGDYVQVSIGQGLMAATPLQLTNAYATLANRGFLMRPHIVRNILAPLTPDREPAVADLDQAVVVESFERPEIKRQLEMPPDVIEPIVRGLTRVTTGPGVEYPSGRYRSTTAENLFETYPDNAIPVAGKTGTAQGARSYPWNDSSAFGAFSLDGNRPYTVVAYLEKSGYGSRAAAPVVKCMFTALSDLLVLDPVQPSDTLDVTATRAAPRRELTDQTCLYGNDSVTIKD